MKSLVIKDLYNVSHNAKSLLVSLIFIGGFLTFTNDGNTSFFSIFCAVLCSTMVVSTFSFDTYSNWEPYAMILPVTRRDVVRGKFVVLILLSLAGCVLGFLLSLIAGTLSPNTTLDLKEQLFYVLPGFTVSVLMSSTSTPLVFKFGAEKARLMLIVAFALPALIIILVFKVLERSGVHLTDGMIVQLFTFAPLLALVWAYLMYRLSCSIFARKEL